jgi:hypothetical protein
MDICLLALRLPERSAGTEPDAYIGFGLDATHTTADTPGYVVESLPALLSFPLHHLVQVAWQTDTESLIEDRVLGINKMIGVKHLIRRTPMLGEVLVRTKALLKECQSLAT